MIPMGWQLAVRRVEVMAFRFLHIECVGTTINEHTFFLPGHISGAGPLGELWIMITRHAVLFVSWVSLLWCLSGEHLTQFLMWWLYAGFL